ncbi:hypothetical protein HIM_01642 [Hirsutella minnesotensis 3608]|nr:hypothetical protein HIM_01642 [Hirsutella minnesotensis 3608]
MSRYESRSRRGDSEYFRPRRSRSRDRSNYSDKNHDSGDNEPEWDHRETPIGLNASYYRDSAEALGVAPPPGTSQVWSQPRSEPPPPSSVGERRRPASAGSQFSASGSERDRGQDSEGDDEDARAADPVERARSIVQDNFSQTTTGLGVGLLGAVVGGFVANRASEIALNQRRSSSSSGRSRGSSATPRLVSTVLGAVAGGLGANAIARKVETERQKHRQQMWEGRYASDDDLGRYESSKKNELERWGYWKDEDEDDDDDYVYDVERRSSRSRRRRRITNGYDDYD